MSTPSESPSVEKACRHCASPMHRTEYGYSYCVSFICGHREWHDPRQPCLCQTCEAERKRAKGQATSS